MTFDGERVRAVSSNFSYFFDAVCVPKLMQRFRRSLS